MAKLKITLGAVGFPGTSRANKTGSWRTTQLPNFLRLRCNGCNLCALLCPDGCVYSSAKNTYYVDLDYCKGCGICAQVCPVNDIEMVRESKEGRG